MGLTTSAGASRSAYAVAVLCAGMWGFVAAAQDATAVVSDTVESEATVQSVDMETRQIVLMNESGSTFIVIAAPEVKNLAQLEAGDVIRTTYSFGVAARLAPAGTEGSTATVAATTAEEGEKPGAIVGSQVTTVVTFRSYDADSHVATLEDEDGTSRELSVEEPEMQAYAQTLEPGDRVEVTFTEAIAIGVVAE